jgi:hypothetical protein
MIGSELKIIWEMSVLLRSMTRVRPREGDCHDRGPHPQRR